MKKQYPIDEVPVLNGLDWDEFVNEDYKPKPVNLKLAKVRSTKKLMREVLSDLLNSENENEDSRLEVVLNSLVEQAERGSLKATELIVKILGEATEKVELSGQLPTIKIVVDGDKSGIREQERIEN